MGGVSRLELFRAVGIIQERIPRAAKRVEEAAEEFEEREWKHGKRHVHGRAWNTSFHASAFPGGVGEKRCGRRALYELLNIPREKFSPKGRAYMDMGNAVEQHVLYRMGRGGLTLGGAVPLQPYGENHQLRFVDAEHWLTGSVDVVLDGRKLEQPVNRPVPSDIKSKSELAIINLRRGDQQPNPGAIAQVLCYNHLSRLVHEDMGWAAMGLDPAAGGLVYHASRNNPMDTYEHWVPWDAEFVDVGLARLKEWIALFQKGELPQRDKSWRWTEEPCKWCEFKKLCKKDVKEGVVELVKSNAVEQAVARDPGYNAVKVVSEVNDAWR